MWACTTRFKFRKEIIVKRHSHGNPYHIRNDHKRWGRQKRRNKIARQSRKVNRAA